MTSFGRLTNTFCMQTHLVYRHGNKLEPMHCFKRFIASSFFNRASDAKSEEKTEVSEEQQQIETLQKEVAEWKDKYTRSLAESENVRRRNVKLLSDAKIYAIQSFAKDLLEVADILEKAIESVPKEEKSSNRHLSSLLDGVEMTEVQLQTVFKKYGLIKLNPVGEVFDPNFHEALFHQPVPEKESGTVAFVEKTGYRLHERPLRAALVAVVK